MLSLDFFESWWIVLSRKNPRKLFPALWIPIWMLLNVLAESVLNSDFITMSFRTQSLKNSTKIRREATILSLNFFEGKWTVLCGKNSRTLFQILWLSVWSPLNVLAESVSEHIWQRIHTKVRTSPTCFTGKNWSLDCMYRSYTDDILVWWL